MIQLTSSPGFGKVSVNATSTPDAAYGSSTEVVTTSVTTWCEFNDSTGRSVRRFQLVKSAHESLQDNGIQRLSNWGAPPFGEHRRPMLTLTTPVAITPLRRISSVAEARQGTHRAGRECSEIRHRRAWPTANGHTATQ
jgi:hypothetical protein